MTPLDKQRIIALAGMHGDRTVDRRGRESFEFDDHGLLAFAAAILADAAQPESLLRDPIKPSELSALPCYCPPDHCQAPVIMGRQMPCNRKMRGEPAPADAPTVKRNCPPPSWMFPDDPPADAAQEPRE